MVKRYQCGSSGTSASSLKVPDGIHVKCSANSWIVAPSTKCKVTCDSGSPKYANIQCKTAGWRPTNQLVCEGTSAGLIIGILIAGIVAVVLIALAFAAYKRNQSKKSGQPMKMQIGKKKLNMRNPVQNYNRPTPLQDRTHSASSGYVGSEPSIYGDRINGSWNNGSRRSHPSSYSGSDIAGFSPQSQSRVHESHELAGMDAMGSPQSGAYHSGYHGNPYAEPPQHAYSSYHNDDFYGPEEPAYGYMTEPPNVGYGATQTHPYIGGGTAYDRPFHLPR